MDVAEYDPVLRIGFSTPAVDQENPPTFGAMVSCISMCIRLLSKVRNPASETSCVLGCDLMKRANHLVFVVGRLCDHAKMPGWRQKMEFNPIEYNVPMLEMDHC